MDEYTRFYPEFEPERIRISSQRGKSLFSYGDAVMDLAKELTG